MKQTKMKNIHVLPTEKPSIICKVDNVLVLSKVGTITNDIKSFLIRQHIYITSDEEIKEGQNYIGDGFSGKNIFKWHKSQLETYPNIKRDVIILTTDQDLIKDGVQAIDDDFLKWFVKNPSCEELNFVFNNRGITGTEKILKTFGEYEIIIPKEEPKQEFPKQNIIDNWLKKNGDPEIAKQVEQEAKDLCEQEILEEASPMNDLLIDLRETKISVKESIDIIEDEFMRTQINIFVQKTLDSVIDRIENELLEKESKWQQEQDKNKYSEEEVLDILFTMSVVNPTNITEWFEQFKNK